MTTQSINVQALSDLPGPKHQRSMKRVLIALVMLAILLFAGAYAIIQCSATAQKAEIVENLSRRMQFVLEERARVLSQWIETQIERTVAISNSDLFRMYADEIDRHGTARILSGSLAEQLPYMRTVLNGLVAQSKSSRASLIDRRGTVYLSTTQAPDLSFATREAARLVYATGNVVIPSLQAERETLYYSILLPIHPVQALSAADARKVIGVLIISAPFDSRLEEILKPGGSMQKGERLWLVQKNGNGVERLASGRIPPIIPQEDHPVLTPGDTTASALLPFQVRRGMENGRDAFSLGESIAMTPWVIVMEADYDEVMKDLKDDLRMELISSGLLVLFIAALLLVLWLVQSGSANRALLSQYKEFTARIQAQRQLLDSINDAIVELISVTDNEGRYVYANTAFAAAVNLSSSMIVGQSAHSLFTPKDAATLTAHHERILSLGVPVATETKLTFVALGERWINLVQTPLFDKGHQTIGIVNICHDITSRIEEQQRRENAVRSTVQALTGTIEAVDPYLSGHSSRTERLVQGIAARLHLSRDESAALEMAANLSQIGKLSIPQNVLTKQGRLTPDERTIMEEHINHAQRILSSITFDLPVPKIIAEMHERLDGSGYPLGLTGSQISLLGRILAVADVFVAQTTARSYRSSMTTQQAIAFLEQSSDQFDGNVVTALKNFLETEEGRTFRNTPSGSDTLTNEKPEELSSQAPLKEEDSHILPDSGPEKGDPPAA